MYVKWELDYYLQYKEISPLLDRNGDGKKKFMTIYFRNSKTSELAIPMTPMVIPTEEIIFHL